MLRINHSCRLNQFTSDNFEQPRERKQHEGCKRDCTSPQSLVPRLLRYDIYRQLSSQIVRHYQIISSVELAQHEVLPVRKL